MKYFLPLVLRRGLRWWNIFCTFLRKGLRIWNIFCNFAGRIVGAGILAPVWMWHKQLKTNMKRYNEYNRLDLTEIQKTMLAEWEKNDLFRQSVTTRKGHTPFLFFEGSPQQTACRASIMCWPAPSKTPSVDSRPCRGLRCAGRQDGTRMVCR